MLLGAERDKVRKTLCHREIMYQYSLAFHIVIMALAQVSFLTLELMVRKSRVKRAQPARGYLRLNKAEYLESKRYVFLAAFLGLSFALNPLLSDMVIRS